MAIKNVVLVVGTRPQIIKSYSLVKSLRKHRFKVDVINTGQHYDYNLAGIFFRDFNTIRPTKNLNIKPGTHNVQLSKIIPKLEAIFQKNRPDLVIAPGDTTTALATAIATVKCGIKLAHLEAGGRSIHTRMQEEINRRLIDHSSDILFSPVKSWATNLKNENVPGSPYFVGDTMYDLFLEEYKAHRLASLQNNPVKNQVLVTLHRAEKITEKNHMDKVCDFLDALSRSGLDLVFPIHPHTKQRLTKFNLWPEAKLVDPVDHANMMKLVAQSSLVVTDSGGLQKEAYWMSKPCIAVHETFEWGELVNEHANFPVWPDKPIPATRIKKILRTKFTPKASIFGAGNASEKISGILKMQ